MSKFYESGRSMVETVLVLAIAFLLVIGGLSLADNLMVEVKAHSTNKHIVSMVTQRRLSMPTIKDAPTKRTEMGAYDIALTIENGTKGNHSKYFWISGAFDSIELYNKIAEFVTEEMKADKVEIDENASVDGSIKARFYFKKYPDNVSDFDEESDSETDSGNTVSDCDEHSDCTPGILCNSGKCDTECTSGEECDSCPMETPYWDGKNCDTALCPANSSTIKTSESLGASGCYCKNGYVVNKGGTCSSSDFVKGVVMGYHWNPNDVEHSLYTSEYTPRADNEICPTGYHWATYDELPNGRFNISLPACENKGVLLLKDCFNYGHGACSPEYTGAWYVSCYEGIVVNYGGNRKSDLYNIVCVKDG